MRWDASQDETALKTRGPRPTARAWDQACRLALRLDDFLRLFRTIIGSGRHIAVIRGFDAQLLAELRIDAREGVFVLLQVTAHIFAALSDALALIAVPRTRLIDDIVQN